jgi:hypothetical protein
MVFIITKRAIIDFELSSGQVKSGIDFELTKAGSIFGCVVDEMGDPIDDARIE